MAIWIEERAAIIGGGKAAWLEAVRTRRAPHLERTRATRLVWCGSTIGSTGRWPEAVALWEVSGSEALAARPDDEHDRQWRAEAAGLASSSVFRTLAPVGMPDLEGLREAGVTGVALSFRTVRFSGGDPREALDSARERAGAVLICAAELPFTVGEALLIHAWPSLEVLARSVERSGEGGVAGGWSEEWAFGSPGNPHQPLAPLT